MEKLRTRLMLDFLRERGHCSMAELMRRFKVSSATVHRDVEELTRRDAVTRVRGGLVFNETESSRPDAAGYQNRVVANRTAKIALAKKALALISEGDIIFLDSSTTVYELAMLLRNANFTHLSIVTNSVSIMQNFRKFPPNYVLIGLGGNYDPQLNSILGAAALEQLSRLNLTKAFVSCFGLDQRTATTNHERQAEMLRNVLDLAERRYLLVDKSKLNRTGLYRLSARGAFNAILTN